MNLKIVLIIQISCNILLSINWEELNDHVFYSYIIIVFIILLTFQSCPMESRHLARMAAALKACEILHKKGGRFGNRRLFLIL